MLSEENPIQMFKKIEKNWPSQATGQMSTGRNRFRESYTSRIHSNENIWTHFLHDSDLF